MSDPIQAYPLTWPTGWKRTPSFSREIPRFSKYDQKLTIAAGADRVLESLDKMGVRDRDVVVSTNIRPTLSGMPRSGERNPDDPGVCVYWTTRNGDQRCIAIDQYQTVAGNLGAIAATLEALRAIERHGGASILDRAFTGFTALPAPEPRKPWFEVLGVSPTATCSEINDAYRRHASRQHPDKGGSHEAMRDLNAARDQGIAQRGHRP